MAIPMMGYILAWAFPIYVNLFQRESMDLHRATDVNVGRRVGKAAQLEQQDDPEKIGSTMVENSQEKTDST
jgi:MFS transporter, FHS family, L-fucose permease